MLPYLAISECSNTSDYFDNESTHLQLYFLGIHETVPLQILTPSLTCQLQIHLREERDEGTAAISQLWTHPPRGFCQPYQWALIGIITNGCLKTLMKVSWELPA